MQRLLVTGGNKGIGFAIVNAILSQHQDTFVLLGSRDARRGEQARQQLLAAHADWAARLEVLELDVSSDASVAAAAGRVRERFQNEQTPLSALVNNAGIGGSAGLRAVLEVNTFGVRRACEAFLPLLDPQSGRIVNVTSAAGPSFVATCSAERQKFLLDPAIQWPSLKAFLDECLAIEGGKEAFSARGLGDGNAYGLSKACANSYTVLLAREHPALRINACTPGFIETDMTRDYAASQGKTPAEMGMQPPASGARAPLFLLFGEPEGNGRFYGSDAQRSPLDRYRAPGTEPYRG
ncbi:MAG TPA: SDR family NAD(P)-dependent oxidoreductase [Polyangiaceae bacterium]|nr:SDR family NAD(P)-dependent oxidoreductase [Polyangiaceae bacterium]